ncbi:cysteine proteinase [Myriangium duriaei CBS 260.36]|uniref:ubiquitinyl hydrolase 1 n=1 Tax=Myriangium duriaei CBS 260.36 TaxID=1168546 RepID=A0A9P4J2M7_9PEZI|nr:cysteine proteinase [Myriangium duriaei CBS 260.36]
MSALVAHHVILWQVQEQCRAQSPEPSSLSIADLRFQTPASPNLNIPKKDAHHGAQTALEKHLADLTGPARIDGSDKFFGFENYSSTCYANSILQSLYYSAPFRNHVINFPALQPQANGSVDVVDLEKHISAPQRTIRSPLLTRPPPSQPGPLAANSPARRPLIIAGTPQAQGQKPDEKDSPEWKKKMLMQSAQVLDMQLDYSDTYGMQESLFTALKDMFEAIISNTGRSGIVSPHKFLEILRKENEMFRSAMHQDAHEFLNLLLNQVVDSVELYTKQQLEAKSIVNGVKNGEINGMAVPTSITKAATGWVHDLFEGVLVSETRCLTCETTSQRDEAFMDLSVDLEAHSSVTSCLRKFSEEEMLCERNKFHCDNCGGLQEAEKRMKIKRLPRILALHLKRFKYTEDYNRLQKLFHRVVYPYHLRLFNTTEDAEDQDRLYELYAVVVHIGGGPYHGHYVSIIKTQDRGWLLFDDELVEPVDKSYVKNFFGGEPKPGVQDAKQLACAYVLFYQETTLEAVEREQEAEAAQAAAAAAKAADATTSPTSPTQQSSLWTNGFRSMQTVVTPTEEKEEPFANLAQSVTAPASFIPSLKPALDTTPGASPALPGGTTVPGLKNKKELKREEKQAAKERKAAEKEAEKAQRQKARDAMEARRDRFKKAEQELQQAIEASKQTKAEEDSRLPSSAAPSVPAAETLPDPTASTAAPLRPAQTANDADRQPSTGGGLGARFRTGSISLRTKKPSFWPGRKESAGAADAVPPLPTLTQHVPNGEAASPAVGAAASMPATPVVGRDEMPPPRSPVIKDGGGIGFGWPKAGRKDDGEKEEKRKNRFSMSRKKSAVFG